MSAADSPLLKTPLHALHLELGARMVPFAGYEMPVQYQAGLIAEHRHTREAAGLWARFGRRYLLASKQSSRRGELPMRHG